MTQADSDLPDLDYLDRRTWNYRVAHWLALMNLLRPPFLLEIRLPFDVHEYQTGVGVSESAMKVFFGAAASALDLQCAP